MQVNTQLGKSVWIDKNTCIFKETVELVQDKGDPLTKEIKMVIKVFANKQVLATVADNDKFGSVFAC